MNGQDDKLPRLFAWGCCDCGTAEKATIPLHNKNGEGKRIIQAICLDCLRLRVAERKEQAGREIVAGEA